MVGRADSILQPLLPHHHRHSFLALGVNRSLWLLPDLPQSFALFSISSSSFHLAMQMPFELFHPAELTKSTFFSLSVLSA
jgi:hypothetical protein